jgi:hypothetical protein
MSKKIFNEAVFGVLKMKISSLFKSYALKNQFIPVGQLEESLG